jgi:hypothetical protein
VECNYWIDSWFSKSENDNALQSLEGDDKRRKNESLALIDCIYDVVIDNLPSCFIMRCSLGNFKNMAPSANIIFQTAANDTTKDIWTCRHHHGGHLTVTFRTKKLAGTTTNTDTASQESPEVVASTPKGENEPHPVKQRA